MQAKGEEAHVPGGGEKQVRFTTGRGAEAPAVYLQAAQGTLREGEEKEER